MLEIERMDAAAVRAALDGLAAILLDAVDGGASVGFVPPFTLADARRWWKRLLPDVDAGEVVVLGARVDGRLVGTVQLHVPSKPNARHRAEVAKLLVHRSARRRGVGTALMTALDDVARQHGRSLLILDTQTGSAAERLYASLGWVAAGVIPDYAAQPGGGLAGTTLFYRQLTG